MKFKQLNESVNAERFAKNVRTRIILPIKDFELLNFAEQEGSTRALEDINRYIEGALEGRKGIIDFLFDIVGNRDEAKRELEHTKKEFKRDSLTGYIKTLDVFLGKITKSDLMKINWG